MSDKNGEVRVAAEGKNARLVFPAELRVGGAKNLAVLLGRVLRKKPVSVILDAAALERIDTAALQAIAVTWHALAEAGIPTRWEHCSPGIVASAKLAGLASAAGMDSR